MIKITVSLKEYCSHQTIEKFECSALRKAFLKFVLLTERAKEENRYVEVLLYDTNTYGEINITDQMNCYTA